MPWGEGTAAFIEVYDWDTVVITSDSAATLPILVNLCVGIFPCALTVAGGGNTIQRVGSGAFSCKAAAGCTGLTLSSLRVECVGGPAVGPIVRVVGGVLRVANTSFANCWSSEDGAAIQNFAGHVEVIDSDFVGLQSNGDGGAISVVGGTFSIQRSLFRHCTAGASGGAIVAVAFQCSGEASVTTTEVDTRL